MPAISIPVQIRNLTEGKDILEVEGTTVLEVLTNLFSKYPKTKDRIVTKDGEILRHLNIFVGYENIRCLDNLETIVKGDEELLIQPGSSGG